MRLRLITLPILLAAAALLPASAQARTHVAVGLGDQSAAMFSNPHFQSLKVKKARYVVRWDAMRIRAYRDALDAWVAAARARHVRPLVHISTNNLTPKRARLLTTKRYRRDVGRLVRHLRRLGVRDIGVWNEENHKSQPTYRSPRRAAAYYRQMRSLCHGCTIVALDVLDQAGVERYIRRWFAALPRSYRHKRLIIGIHNYSDTNRRRSRGTSSIIRTVRHYARHARFWLTETGGVVNFGRAWPCSTNRAAHATSYMFRLAHRYDRYLERLYAYNFFGADCRGFDAGLVASNGAPRRAYWVFKQRLRSFVR
jgi:hypothetical protein